MKTVTREKLIDVICESGDGEGREAISNNTDFVEVPMDSLDIMAAFQAVEDAFGASIPDEVMPELRNLQDLVAYLGTQDISVT